MSIYQKYLALLIVLLSLVSCAKSTKTLLFIGSYTDKKPGTGIYVYEFDTESGLVQPLDSVTDIINPSFLRVSPDGAYLYAATESQLPTHGKVTAFGIDSLSGKLTELNKQDAGGRNPAHITVSKNGRFVINSNYTDSSLGVMECLPNGSLKPLQQLLRFTDSSVVVGRQDTSHMHSTNFTPDGDYVVAQDLGADKMRVFRFRPNEATPLQPNFDLQVKVKPGSGPRHFTFHPNGGFAYGIAELSGSIFVYAYEKGQFSFLKEYLSYSKEQEMYRAADIHIAPDGKFLYASNRSPKENTIAIFAIDQKTGNLTLVGHKASGGEHPRNFAIDPSGNFLLVANQYSNNVVIFRRNKNTGLLSEAFEITQVFNPSSIQLRTYQKH